MFILEKSILEKSIIDDKEMMKKKKIIIDKDRQGEILCEEEKADDR